MTTKRRCSASCPITNRLRRKQFADTQYHELLHDKMEQFAKTLKDKELVIYRERLLNEEPADPARDR